MENEAAESAQEPVVQETQETQQEPEVVTMEDLTGEGTGAKEQGAQSGEKGGGEQQESAAKTQDAGDDMKQVASLLLAIAGPKLAQEFAKDRATQDAIAAGADPIKAFQKFRERREQGAGKTGVPTSRQQSTAGTRQKSVWDMTSEEFARFDEKVQRAIANGKRVKL